MCASAKLEVKSSINYTYPNRRDNKDEQAGKRRKTDKKKYVFS